MQAVRRHCGRFAHRHLETFAHASEPVTGFHIFTFPSSLTVTRRFPSGNQASPVMLAEWAPRNIVSHWPVVTSQIIGCKRFALLAAVASFLPSGEKANLIPLRVERCAPVAASSKLVVVSMPPLT